MFKQYPRCQYENNQLYEVICQLRFPEILTINENVPAAFQDEIRAIFPQYSCRAESQPPKIANNSGILKIEQPPVVNNYQFVSEDGTWRVNLTSRFISLSCSYYTNWETFAKRLDSPLVAFIKTYKPAYFERIGLRYMNFFSRAQLSLEEVPFSELFEQPFLGILGENDVNEKSAMRSSVDAEVTLDGGCRVTIHSGPGMVQRNGTQDKEVKFILDQDLFMPGNIPVNYSAGALETLHRQAFPIFRSAITEKLHNAMNPIFTD